MIVKSLSGASQEVLPRRQSQRERLTGNGDGGRADEMFSMDEREDRCDTTSHISSILALYRDSHRDAC
jgi:hypothetical protein